MLAWGEQGCRANRHHVLLLVQLPGGEGEAGHLPGALRGQGVGLGRAEGRAAHVGGAQMLRQRWRLRESCAWATQS